MTDNTPMPMNYTGNSHKSKDRPVKKVEKVIHTDAVIRKKPLGRKVREMFTGNDAKSVASYVFVDVMIPAARNMLFDMVTEGASRALFGDTRPVRRTDGTRGYTSYDRIATGIGRAMSPDLRSSRPTVPDRVRATHDFGEIVLPTRAEAQLVLDGLNDLIDQYNVATVGDLYDLLGTSHNFPDELWGWTDIRGSYISQIRDGYLLNLPETRQIDK